MSKQSRGFIVQKRSVKFAWAIALVAVILFYSSLYFFNTYPTTEGWGINYAELIGSGMVPYRDFYYYLPPLNIWVDALLWRLSGGLLLVYRAWRLAERIGILLLVFNYLSRYFNSSVVWLGCAFTGILYTGNVYDLFGDYNQTPALLAMLLIYCATGFADRKGNNSRYSFLLIGGIILGGMFLLKQPVFVASFAVFFLCFSAFCFKYRDKHYLSYCGTIAAGLVLPIIPAFVYLASNNAFQPFVEQVFLNVDGKGSLYNIMLGRLILQFTKYRALQMALLIIGVTLLFKYYSARNKGTKWSFYAKKIGLIVVLVSILIGYRDCIVELLLLFQKYPLECGIMLASLLPFITIELLNKYKKKLIPASIEVLSIASGVIISALCVFNSETFTRDFVQQNPDMKTRIYELIEGDFSTIIFFVTVSLCFYFFSRKDSRSDALFFFTSGALSLIYECIMNSNYQIVARVFMFSLPLIICCTFSFKIDQRGIVTIWKFLLGSTCVLLSVVCIAQKCNSAYTWWGWTDYSVHEKVYPVDIPALKGLKLSAEQKEIYEEITKLVEENSDEDDVVWGYPHIKIFNVLTNRYKMSTFMPVLFYDVSADSYVAEEVSRLKENPPDIIIWETIPNCLEVHESAFREGKLLKQREIVDWFHSVANTQYTMIGRIGYYGVYRLNDGYPIKSTYYKQDSISLYPVEGVYAPEPNFTWCQKEAQYTINSNVEHQVDAELKTRLIVSNAETPGQFTVKLNDQIIFQTPVDSENSRLDLDLKLPLKTGDNKLVMTTTTQRISAPEDPRELYFQIVTAETSLVG